MRISLPPRKAGRPSRARLRLTCLEDRTTPVTLTPATTPTATDNDYTRIQNAVNAAADGDTILLQGTFRFTEPRAAASWARGSDGIANTFDDYSVYVPDGLTGVTMSASSLGAGVVQGPGDLAALDLEGFLYFDGLSNQGWTVSNLDIRDFDMSIGMFAKATTAFDGVKIVNNHIRMAADLNGVDNPNDPLQNIGIHYAYGKNQIISGNLIDIPGNGRTSSTATDGDLTSNPQKFATSIGIQSDTSGGDRYDGLSISNNTIRVLNAQSAFPERVIGIWENGHAHNSNITISGNQFVNLAAGNNPSLNRQQGFWVTSHSNSASGTTVTYSGNSIDGAQLGFLFLGGQDFSADPANTAIRFLNNTLTDVWSGFLVQSNGKAHLSGNVITGVVAGNGSGVAVMAGSSLDADSFTGANRVTRFAIGMRVEGTGRISGAVVRDNAVGIQVDGGTALVELSDLRFNSTAGLRAENGATMGGIVDAGQAGGSTFDFTGLGISAGKNNFAQGYSAAGAKAIIDANTGPAYNNPGPDGLPLDLMAQGNFFASDSAAFIESVVTHDTDDPALGFVDYSFAEVLNDVSLTAVFVTAPAFVNQHLTLLIRVTNNGPAAVSNVVVQANVPAGAPANFLSVVTSQGTASQTAGVVTALIGTLAPGQTAAVRVVVQPTAAGTLTSTATVTADGTDVDTSNNTRVATVTVANNQGGVVKAVRSGKSLVLTGDSSANAVQVIAGAAANSYQVIGLGGTRIKFGTTTAGSATVTGVTAGMRGALAGGSDTLIVDGSGTNAALAFGGAIADPTGAGDDVVYILHVTATGALTVTGGTGNNRGEVSESSFSGMTWQGAGGNDALTVRDTAVTTTLTASGGAGNDRLDIAQATIGKNFSWAGSTGNDDLLFVNSSVGGNTTLTGLGGVDSTMIDGSTFTGTFNWNGGADNDTLDIRDSKFTKAFTANGSSGDDAVAVVRTMFLSTARFDGSTGNDRLDAGTASSPPGSAKGNSFAKTPTVVRFETILS